MAIYAFQLDELAVYVKLVPHHLLLFEANLLGANIRARFHDKRIEIWLFGAPEVDAIKLDAPYRFCAILLCSRRGKIENLLAFGIVKRGRRWSICTVCGKLERDLSILIIGIQLGRENEIGNAGLRTRPKRHIAIDARETEHILILKITTIAPAENLHSQEVFAILLHKIGDIELGSKMRILRVANHLAVDPHIISRIDTIKPENDLTPIPVLGQSKRAAIGGDRIEICKPRLSIENLGP